MIAVVFQLKMADCFHYGPFCVSCGSVLRVESCAHCCPAATVDIPDDGEVVTAMKLAADSDGFATVGSTIITVEPVLPSAPHPDLMRLLSMLLCPRQIVVFYFGNFGSMHCICRFSAGWVELVQPKEALAALTEGRLCYVIAGGSLSSVHLFQRAF